jgi:uncharacterized membrane protein
MKTYSIDIFRVSLALSVISMLIILSFSEFFIYVPLSGGISLLTLLGLFAFIGWIALVVLPPIFLLLIKNWNLIAVIAFISVVSLYTAATFAVKIYSLATMGAIYAQYLILYPALFLVEWIIPAFYIYVALRLRRATQSKASAGDSPRSDFRVNTSS